MKIGKGISRPHPLLCPLSDDVTPNQFDLELRLECDRVNWYLDADIIHSNGSVTAFVENGDAVYGLHFECRSTFHRSLHTFNRKSERITIPAGQLRGKVEVCAFAVVAKNIHAYSVSGCHTDYGNRTFKVGRGEIIAASSSMEFDAFLDYDPIKRISSILNIERSENKSLDRCDISFDDSRKIVMTLPQADFDLYRDLRADPGLQGMIAASVVFPAILEALHFLRALDPDELEDEKLSKIWVRSILKKLAESGCDLRSDSDDSSCFAFAQVLLRCPLRRGLSDLSKTWEI